MKTTIAINLGHSFVAIEATLISCGAIAAALHKAVGKKGWTVTDPRTGLAFCREYPTALAATSRFADLVTRRGEASVQAFLAKHESAPAVETLKAYAAPVKPKAVKADIPAIVEAVHNTVPLTEREQAAVVTALNSRTGQLKAKSPSAFGDADEQLACAAWQGLQPNGYKIGTLSCICLRGEARELFDKLAKVRWPAALDKDKAALVAIGAW
jgi:hypothetical protein